MILPNPEDMVNIVVRAVILREEHIWVSQWDDGRAFLIGGRMEHGEVPDRALIREIHEETGLKASCRRLLGVGDVVWTNRRGKHVHEFGWYFAVDLLEPAPPLGARLPNPDHAALHTTWLPVAEVAERVRPRMVRHVVDQARQAEARPWRYWVERDGQVSEPMASLLRP